MSRISSKTRFCQVILLLGIAALTVSGAAIAQERGMRQGGRPGGGPGGQGGSRNPDQMVARMTEYLSLTEEQQEQIRGIYKERAGSAQETMKQARDSGADREAKRAMMMEFRAETDKKVEAVLDEKQAAEFRKMREQRAQAMKKRMSERGEREVPQGREGRPGPEGRGEPAAPDAPATTE